MIKHLIMTNNATRSSELTEEQRARCHDFTVHSSAIGQKLQCQIVGMVPRAKANAEMLL
jgi:hypothetical protein